MEIKESRFPMNKQKSKQRAVGLLLLLGTIFFLIATWDFPDDRSTR